MASTSKKAVKISQKHLLGIQDLSISDINYILSEAKEFISLNKSKNKKLDILRGKTQINLFFEPSTRTQSSFELAGKRLGADVMSMNIVNSAIKKGETLIDTPILFEPKSKPINLEFLLIFFFNSSIVIILYFLY